MKKSRQIKKISYRIGIVLLMVFLISGIIFSFGALWKEKDSIPISLMSVNSKYGGKWKDKFKFKNGSGSHSFKIKDKTTLNANWHVEDGYIEAKIYNDDKIIKELNSDDYPNYKELIDLSQYEGSKIILKLKFEKASGKIEFILE